MTHVAVRSNSSVVGILGEKHSRVATKVAFGDWTDLRKSPEENKHIRMTYVEVCRCSLGVGILGENHHRRVKKIVFGDWTLRKSPEKKETH